MAKRPTTSARSTRKVADCNEFSDLRLRTPVGEARYAYLTRPDDYGNAPKFKITVVMDPSTPEFKTMAAQILEYENGFRAAKGFPAAKVPSCIKPFKDDDGNDTGKVSLTAKVKAKADDNGEYTPIVVVDAARQPTQVGVWGGDTVRVSFGVGGYVYGGKVGSTCYLRAVQLLAQNSDRPSGPSGTDVFDVEESFFDAPEDNWDDESDDDIDVG